MSTRATWLGRIGLVAVVTAVPSVALACPLCLGSMSEANRLAFLGTMVLLTSLPVIMIGGLIFWVAKRASAPDTDQAPAEQSERPEAPRLIDKT